MQSAARMTTVSKVITPIKTAVFPEVEVGTTELVASCEDVLIIGLVTDVGRREAVPIGIPVANAESEETIALVGLKRRESG